MNIDISKYINDERAVLIFTDGQVEWVNDACRELSEGLDLPGYELEYVTGEELAETILSATEDSFLSFGGFEFCGHRGLLEVELSGDSIILIFTPIYRFGESDPLREYRRLASRLSELQVRTDAKLTGGMAERIDSIDEYGDLPSSAEIRSLRIQRRIEQIELLERCFDMKPITGELTDLTELCVYTLTRCAELLGSMRKQLELRRMSGRKLERVFNRGEVERMLSCLLSGSIMMCGDEPIDVSVSVSEDTLRVDLTSSAESFSEAGFAAAMRLPNDSAEFAESGRGLELLVASELASRYFGKLQFTRSGGVGRLSLFISPSFYGMEGVLNDALAVSESLYPQYLIELSEML